MMIRFYLVFLTLSCATFAKAQPSSSLNPDDLDYYLVQAFKAADADNRVSLNHIGVQVQQAETVSYTHLTLPTILLV